jgi:hypothetical protein
VYLYFWLFDEPWASTNKIAPFAYPGTEILIALVVDTELYITHLYLSSLFGAFYCICHIVSNEEL